MAAGAVTIFNIAKGKLLNGTVDIDGHTFKVVLCNSTQALPATFVGASTDARYADLTGELTTGSGYTAGGVALASVTWTQATATWKFDAADTSWAGITATFKYVVCFDDTAANDPLIWVIDCDTGGGSVSVSAGTLTVQYNASGIFTLT